MATPPQEPQQGQGQTPGASPPGAGSQSPGAPPAGAQPPPPGGAPATAPAGAVQGAPSPPGVAGAQLAGFWPRVGALVLDALLLLVILIPLSIVVALAFGGGAFRFGTGASFAANFVGAILGIVVWGAYAGFLMARPGHRNGQTLGRQVTNIRAVRDDGSPFDFATAAIRDGAVKIGIVSILQAFVPFAGFLYLVDFLFPLFENENRTVHDLIVKTHVVNA